MKISVAFSGGALRSAAQVGALRFLEDQGVEIAAVSGSSAGAMVAFFVAAGWRSERMESFLKTLRRRDLFRFDRSMGLLSLHGVERLLRREIGSLGYEDLLMPCYTCVTELESACTHYFNSGDPVENLLASSSLTPLFSPRKIDGIWYIDGGFSDNLPVHPLRSHGYKILSINVNPLGGSMPTGFRSLFRRSLMILLNSNIRPSKELSDAYLEVQGVEQMNLFGFKMIDEAIETGYREMEDAWERFEKSLL